MEGSEIVRTMYALRVEMESHALHESDLCDYSGYGTLDNFVGYYPDDSFEERIFFFRSFIISVAFQWADLGLV